MPNLVINVFAKIEEAGQNINKFSLYNLKKFQQVLNHGKNKSCHTHFKVIHNTLTAEFFLDEWSPLALQKSPQRLTK